ncbi:MAG: hypothetical protein AAEC03_01065 [Synechococcus sp.]
MPTPAWFLLAWVVVAFASLWKFWTLTAPWRARKEETPQENTEEFRQLLERRWHRSKR